MSDPVAFNVAELARLDLRDGDTVVLMFPGRLSDDQARRVLDTWDRVRPDIKCVIMQEGATVGVIRGTG